MDVDLIFKIAAIGILVAVLNQVLSRAGRDEQAMMTTLAGLVVVCLLYTSSSARKDLRCFFAIRGKRTIRIFV